VVMTDTAYSVFTTNDPANVSGVGTDIDQYVDHWQYWGPPATSDTSDDFTPFLPLGDTVDTGWTGDNASGDKVTCVTCHNPHGTDLFVNGKTPGAPDGDAQIPANRMLRMRDTDGEMCNACHR
ncbi:MAG: hypothetical protein RRA32_09345, partial [bacterium]|nr:hypothetical protein [bacterium]